MNWKGYGRKHPIPASACGGTEKTHENIGLA